ncbi:netrin receptor UNC5C-like [Anneissia japonica]|uniref:netrin receptor UNC5C-like n=1 Tax=Anneissia japonica TaxID=1529436 RepID=UPI0014258086|nr:netrin receptor UNC5C-like [Anneissia japonica]
MQEETKQSVTLKPLMDTIIYGWPDKPKKLPKCIRMFWSSRNSLATEDDLILQGNIIIVQEKLRPGILKISTPTTKIGKRSTSMAVFKRTKSIFSEHGIPNKIVIDNGPHFSSIEFRNFVNNIECKVRGPREAGTDTSSIQDEYTENAYSVCNIEREQQTISSDNITHKPITYYKRCIAKAELWSKQTSLGNYDQHSFACPFFRAGIFDKYGGELHFDEAGVMLLVPPGAIQQSTPQLIYIYLHHEQNEILPIPPNMMATSPVVFCGPSGMVFDQRVLLSYQHCANIKNNNTNLITLRTETEPDQSPSFHNLSEDNDSITLIKGNTVTLMLSHFTGHTSVVQCEEEKETVIHEKWLNLMLFSSQINDDDYDLQLRLYCANQTEDARYIVLEDERLLEGSLRSPTFPFLFASISDINVLLNSEGNWKVRGGKTKQVRCWI